MIWLVEESKVEEEEEDVKEVVEGLGSMFNDEMVLIVIMVVLVFGVEWGDKLFFVIIVLVVVVDLG